MESELENTELVEYRRNGAGGGIHFTGTVPAHSQMSLRGVRDHSGLKPLSHMIAPNQDDPLFHIPQDVPPGMLFRGNQWARRGDLAQGQKFFPGGNVLLLIIHGDMKVCLNGQFYCLI